MQHRDTCRTCRFWSVPLKDRDTVEYGLCRRRAPALEAGEEQRGPFAAWPLSDSDQWCGEHEEAWYGTEEGPEDRRRLFSKINQLLSSEDRDIWNRFLADLRLASMEIHAVSRATVHPNPHLQRTASRLREPLIGVPFLEGS